MSKKANPYENFLNVLDSAAALDGIDQNDYAAFRYPEQELKVNFPVRMDNGELKMFTGYHPALEHPRSVQGRHKISS